MAVVSFTLSEEGVTAFRDALICLSKFSDDVSIEARKDVALTSLFRSRTATDLQREVEKQTLIDRCDVSIEDGEGIESRFVARLVFRNGLTSTHHLPFEVSMPVHAKFNKKESPHFWKISSRTLRQLLDHFGPGIEYLDVNTDGDHVNFTCFSEKTVSEDAVLKKPLQTSIAIEVDEFDEIEVEDGLHIVISVKDFRAIIQHAGIISNDVSACYSQPSRPIQLAYGGDAIACEFLIMTVGERNNPTGQKTKKGRKKAAPADHGARLEATLNRASAAPSETPHQDMPAPPPVAITRVPLPNPTLVLTASGLSTSRLGSFDLRPSQRAPPPATMRSESLFVDDDSWQPVNDEDEEEDDAVLGWDPSERPSTMDTSWIQADQQKDHTGNGTTAVVDNVGETQEASYIDPTQRLTDVQNLALFPDTI